MNAPNIDAIGAKIKAHGVLGFREEFCPWAGRSAVTGYKLIAQGKVKTAKIGRRRVITAANALAFLTSLESAEAA